MSDILEKLREKVSKSEKDELTLAHNGRITAMKAYNDRPGKDTKADLDAARQMFDETLARLTAIYFPEDVPAPEGERFPNRIQALNWLHAQGFKVSQGKFYKDCENGFPAIHRDKSVSRYQIMQYSQQIDAERRSMPAVDLTGQREADEARKIKADADKAEMQSEDMRREQDRKWLHQDDAYMKLASLIGTLRDSLRHQCHVGQSHIIHLAAGDPSRGPEVYEGMEEIMARAFNDVLATSRIDGIFDDMNEEDQDAA